VVPRGSHRPAPSRPLWVLGADIGGTKIVAGLVDPAGAVRARHRREVPSDRDPEGVLRATADCLAACRAEAPEAPRAIGVGVAGQVEPGTGTVRYAPNLRWRDVPLGSRLGELSGLPVAVANDVRTITLGEWRFGEGRGCRNLLCLFVGTGIGGGAVIDGRLAEGAAHALGEVGHTPLVADGRPCHCPNRGCLEAYVGGWAIAERVRELAAREPAARGLIARAGGIDRIEPRTVELAAREGDPFASAFVHERAEEFATGLVGLVNAFNPERVVVGGKIVEGFPEYLAAARRAVAERCQPPAAAAEIRGSRLHADAGILGAAHLARELFAARRRLR
jgi:glucokinase